MSILDFLVRRRAFTIVMFAMLIAIGVTSWNAIPRGEDPPLDFPGFSVVVVYPGASPTDLERLIVRDLEESLDELENVKDIESRMVEGLATVFVEFEASEDPDEKHDEVLRQVNAARASFPAEVADVSVRKTSTLDVAIAQIALVSETTPYHELDRMAERLTDRLGAVPGVRRAERWGAPERQVDVALDLGRLARLQLPSALVLQAIAGESADIPAGTVEAGSRRFVVRASGSYESLDEIAGTVVRNVDGQLVRVRDVAEVRWSYADSTYRARYNGHRAVFVTVTQQDGQRISDVRDRVWGALDAYERELPAAVALERGFDQARNVDHRLGRLRNDFLIAIALVSITLLPIGLRAAGIVMVSIPLSLAMGVALLHLTGFTINQLSIVGGVIALGLLVDDSIVVVENITRFIRDGYSRMEAAVLATRQIAVAVLGATATLVFAFVPLMLLPGGPGDYIRSMPAAVIYTVLASLVVSLTIIPWLASIVLPRERGEHGTRALRATQSAIHRTYAPILERALGRPLATLIAAGAFVIVSLLLIPVVGFSLFPRAETPQFYINVTAEEGSSIETTDRAVRFVEDALTRREEVTAVFSSIGHDNPRVYYNIFPRRDDPRVGQVFVVLDAYHPERTTRMLDSLRAELASYPGAKLEVREFENGPPIDAPIALRVQGPELDTIRVLAAQIERAIESTDGTQYVTNPLRVQRTNLRVAIDRAKAGLLGAEPLEIDRTIRLGLEGVRSGVLREATGDARDVIVRLASDVPRSPATLDLIHVATSEGSLTPLRQLADVKFETGVPEIERYDRERAVTVTSFVRTGYNTDRVTRDVLSMVEDVEFPPGYRLEVAGEVESRSESFGGLGSAIVVATFVILAILILEFHTVRGMLIVASVIPLGAAGGIIALALTGHTLSFTAMIGFVALIGIEIKTSILLVEFTNQLRKQGVSLDEAIRTAGEVRFLPIVLTTLTAIGGLLPLAIEGQALYAPLAWVIIGGLISSTLLARIVTPVLYKVLAPPVS
jgi:multidrug efflux pump subunit AcrB